MRKPLWCVLLLPLFAACAVETSDTDDHAEADRGDLGKADLVGSCALPNGNALCEGKGTGNCWCDQACADFGDCCSDAAQACGIEPPVPEGESCGGIAGLECDEHEFCFYTPEQICGAADHLGECVTRPEACIFVFDPVCGCDEQTYSNACFAAQAGTSVLHHGECGAPQTETCEVAGCSGELCVGPEGPHASACIWDPAYECLAHTQCGNFGPEGSCGWQQTPAYVECLEAHGAVD